MYCICLLMPFILLVSVYCKTIDLTLSVSSTNIIRKLPETFIGFNLDYWKNNHEHFGNSSIPYIDFSNKNLIALTSALQPAVLRIGGSGEDSVIYNISNECNEPWKWNISGSYYCSEVHPPNYYCLTKTRWKQIFDFLDATNLKLVFGLNACYGRKGKAEQMDISNINSLLHYTATSNILNISRLYGFEFGNGMAGSIDSQIYSYDFIRMNALINSYFESYTNTVPVSIGTDNQYSNTEYVEQVLNMSNGTMNIVNYHQYTNCQQQKQYIFDKDCLSDITSVPQQYEKILNNTHQMNSTLMVGESALDHSGGQAGASNVFLSSFYYSYQLSELAKVNDMNLVQRQTLSGGWYGLLSNNNSFVPMPDYWILYLWRKFIGSNVLQTTLTNNQNVTGYAFNGKVEEDIVIVLINFSDQDTANVELKVNGIRIRSLDSYKYEEYHMNGPLDSETAYVNSKPLLYEDGQFPTLEAQSGDGNVMVQPATIVWIVCIPQ